MWGLQWSSAPFICTLEEKQKNQRLKITWERGKNSISWHQIYMQFLCVSVGILLTSMMTTLFTISIFNLVGTWCMFWFFVWTLIHYVMGNHPVKWLIWELGRRFIFMRIYVMNKRGICIDFCYTPPIPTVFVDCFFHLAAACSELRSNHSISLIKDDTPSCTWNWLVWHRGKSVNWMYFNALLNVSHGKGVNPFSWFISMCVHEQVKKNSN